MFSCLCFFVLYKMKSLLFEGVGDQKMHILAFIQQQHGAQVAYALVCETWGRNQLQAFQLVTHTILSIMYMLMQQISCHGFLFQRSLNSYN